MGKKSITVSLLLTAVVTQLQILMQTLCIIIIIIIIIIIMCTFSDAYAKLLSSGELNHKSSIQCKTAETDLPPILAKICFYCHFSGK